MGQSIENLSVTLTLDNRPFVVSVQDAERIIQRLENRLDEAGAGANKLEGGFGRAAAAVRNFSQTADSVRNIERHVTSLTSRIRDVVVIAGMFRFAMADLHDVFIAMPMGILKTSGEIERMTKMLEGLSQAPTELMRVAEANKSVQGLFAMAQNAPFEVSQLTDAYVKLRVAGVKPLESSMTALVDSVAKTGGTGEQLKRASVAIQQMVGKGSVSMEELRQQLGEAVPTAMQAMATGMRMSMGELVKLVSTGTVQAEGAIKRMMLVLGAQNAGASAKMMETYVGQVAQLKTNWQLFQKAVGDSGFLKSVEEVLKEINGAFASPEMRGFAKTLGEGMGTAVRSIAITAKEAMNWLTEMKWIAGWFLTSFAVSRLTSSLQSVMGSMNAVMAKGRALDLAKREAAVAAIAAERASLAVSLEAEQTRLNARRAANTQMVNASAQMAMQIAALEAANAEKIRRLGEFGAKNIVARNNAEIARIAGNAAALDRSVAAYQRETAAITANTAALRAKSAAKVVEIEQTVAGNVAMGAQLGTMGRLTGLMGGAFRMVLAAAGGWIGLITMALWAGVMAWDTWGNKGEKEIKRIRDAINSGTSERGDLKSLDNDIAQKQATLDKLEAQRKKAVDPTAAVQNSMTPAGLANMDMQIRKARDDIRAAKDMRAEAAKVITGNESDVIARKLNEDASKTVQTIYDGAQKKVGADREAFEKEIEGKKLTGAQRQAAEKKLREGELKTYADGEAAVLDQLKKTKAEFEAKREGLGRDRSAGSGGTVDSERVALNSAITELNRKILESQDKVKGFKDAVENASPLNASDKGKGKAANKNPLKDMLSKANGDLAEARVKLDEMGEGIRSFAAEKEAIQKKLDEQFANGDFDKTVAGKTVKVSAEEFRKLSDEISTAQAKVIMAGAERKITAQANKNLADSTEDLARAEQHLADGVDKTKSPFEQAKERIAKMRIEITATGEALTQFNASAAKEMANRAAEGVALWAAEARKKTTEDIAASADSLDRAKNEYAEKVRLIQATSNARRTEVAEAVTDAEKKQALLLQIEEQTDAQLQAARKLHTFETRTALEQLLDDWKNTTKQMENAKAQWAQSFVDTFVDGIRKGKIEWGALVEQILADILKMKMQKMMGDAIGAGVDGIGSFFGFGGGAGAESMIGNMGADMLIPGFANGGIMTQWGEVPLRAYANGGIANAPQAAVFGEGSMPEAYVPLPDGRSIPVTMQGGTQGAAVPAVTINLINQSGTQVGAQAGQPRMDGKQMVLDVVLTAINKPGPFRDGMKGALA